MIWGGVLVRRFIDFIGVLFSVVIVSFDFLVFVGFIVFLFILFVFNLYVVDYEIVIIGSGKEVDYS